MLRKRLFFGLGILLLGIGIGYFLASSLKPLPVEPNRLSAIEQSALQIKLQSLADHEISDYYRLKTLEEKYRKADEILGKIVTIFLADLGIRVSSNTQAKTGQGLADPPANTSRRSSPATPPPVGVEKGTPAWKVAEKNLPSLRDEHDVTDFLDKVKFSDPDASISETTAYMNRTNTLDSINGKFTGQAQVTQRNANHTWDVELLLKGVLENGGLTGRAQVTLSENGRTFSNKSDDGNIIAFREFKQDSSAILVEVSPTTVLQLYYVSSIDSLIGNVYTKEHSSYSQIGTLVLKRSS